MANFIRLNDLVINLDTIATVTRGENATYVYYAGDGAEFERLEGEKATALWNFLVISAPNICPNSASRDETAEDIGSPRG